jgi:hypothetical protein
MGGDSNGLMDIYFLFLSKYNAELLVFAAECFQNRFLISEDISVKIKKTWRAHVVCKKQELSDAEDFEIAEEAK